MSKTISVQSIIDGIEGAREAYISYLYNDTSDKNQLVDLTTLVVGINLTPKRAVNIIYDLTMGVDLNHPEFVHRERQLQAKYRRNMMAEVDTGVVNEPYDMTAIMDQIKTYQWQIEYVLDWLACDQSTDSHPRWEAIDFTRPLGQPHNSTGQ